LAIYHWVDAFVTEQFSNDNPLTLIERDLIAGAVVQLRRLG
jgi:hypothetical protein